MDPVTHGLIGAATSQSFADKSKLRIAALVGAAGAMMPDLDVLIDSAADPLLQLEYHRTITHSLIFIPFGALFVAGILWWFLKSKLSFKETYIYSLLGIATAGIADTCTSYGVQLLWPFTDIRFSWNLISVFDPLLTLGILIPLGLALYKKKRISGQFAFLWMFFYLLFGLFQQQKAESVAQELAMQRNHSIEHLVVKPTIANELLWSIRYVHDDTLYADGVRLMPFTKPNIYEGRSTPLVPWPQKYAHFRGTVLYNDITRFNELSDGILIAHPSQPNVIGDGRYAMLPTSITPLWGIKIDTTNPSNHVDFNTYRDASQEVRNTFLDMLSGQ